MLVSRGSAVYGDEKGTRPTADGNFVADFHSKDTVDMAAPTSSTIYCCIEKPKNPFTRGSGRAALSIKLLVLKNRGGIDFHCLNDFAAEGDFSGCRSRRRRCCALSCCWL